MRKFILLAVAAVVLLAQPGSLPSPTPLLPLWSGPGYKYFTLGSGFKITGSVIDVTQPTPVAPAFAPDEVHLLTQPQATFTLRCAMADIYWDEFNATAGVDYSVTGLVVTFSPNTPAAGDVVKITYRCQ